MIKFSKMFFTNPAKIWISNIKCSFNNVVKIIKVFNCEWMTMTIDSIAEGSALLTLLIGEIGSIVTKSASVIELVSLDLFVFAPIIIKRFKYDTDLGAMLIAGFIRTAIWAVAFVGGVYLVRNNPLIYKILLWPAVK